MNRVSYFVTAACALALVTLALVIRQEPRVVVAQVEAVAWLSALGFISLLQVHSLPKRALGSIAFIPWLASALLSPNWLSVAAVALASLGASLLARRALLKSLFNIAQMSLAVAAAILSYRAVGGESLLALRELDLLSVGQRVTAPLAALVLTFFVVNSAAVSGVIGLSEGKNPVRIWKQNTLGTAAYDVLSAPIVFVFAWVYAQTGALGAAGLALPLLGARQLYKTNRQLEQVNEELLQLMVKAIEARDPYTSGHSRRVAHYSRLIARAIGLNAKQVDRIGIAALLHDVGKIHEIYAPILRKPGKLTPEEWAIMETHPVKSAELVMTVSGLRDLIGPVRHHHENWDGTGYPDKLGGEAIPLGARIIKFADTIDAMTSDRPYRLALGAREVRAELEKFRGSQFDPGICDRLLESPLFDALFEPQIEAEASRRRTPARATPIRRIGIA